MGLKKKLILRELVPFTLFVVALTAFLVLASTALLPRRVDFGSTWDAFLMEDRDSLDVLFFGSSVVYCDVAPGALYENDGIVSYVMGGSEQTLPLTYYYVKETLRSQSPSLIAVEVTSAFFPKYTDFAKINVGYMPWSANRLMATFLVVQPEERLGLLFPLYNYHSRWKEPHFGLRSLARERDDMAGYTPLLEATDPGERYEREVVFDQSVYDENIDSVKKIANLAKSAGARVLFFIAPTYRPWEKEYVDRLKGDIAGIEGLADFVDFNEAFDDMPLDPMTDFYDALHFNIYGADKFAIPLGDEIRKILDAEPESVKNPGSAGAIGNAGAAGSADNTGNAGVIGSADNSALWETRAARFRELLASQS